MIRKREKMFFQEVPEAPPDPIFGLANAFKADSRKQKVDLTAGIYKDDQLRSELLRSVREAKINILSKDLLADYLPIDGLAELVDLLGLLVFGIEGWKGNHTHIYGAHATGGTGALRIAVEFLAQQVSKFFYIPNHSWPNHRAILERAGCMQGSYPYYDRKKRAFDLEAVVAFMRNLPPKSVILLHACCHNPTGCDPTMEEWAILSRVCKEKQLFPLFDFAYQGLGEGLEADAGSIRIFLQDGHEMAIAYSCAKNFSMYCQRVGALYVVCGNAEEKKRVGTQIKRCIRALYSNPPAHGARIVAEVLRSDDLRKIWYEDLKNIRKRIHLMREALIQRLMKGTSKTDYSYLKFHKGMFSFIDMKQSQVQRMIDEFAIYMIDNGRMSISGLTLDNIDYVANSLKLICENP